MAASSFSVILKTERGGRMSVVDSGPAITKVEAQASRLRFKDEACSYCVYTGFFKTVAQAEEFCRLRNAGISTQLAIRRANPDLPRSN